MKILFLDMSTRLTAIDDLATRARGGMVSSLFRVPDELSKLGHDVGVLSDIKYPGVTRAGVHWLNDYQNEFFDILVTNRGVGKGYPEINAKARVLWTHDLPHNGYIQEPKTIRAFAATVFMSRYAERIWRAFYPTIGRSFLIPNGVDKDLFYPREKEEDYLIYISAPNRGLRRLPLIYEAAKNKSGKELKLKAFTNLAKLHPNEGEDHFELDYLNCREAGIEVLNPVPQGQLAEELGRAALMVVPTDYPEICSNSLLQSLASGTPVITTGNIGSAGEWLKHGRNAMLTEFQPRDYMIYQLEMVRNLIAGLENREKLARNAAKTKVYSWQEIGWQWHKMLKKVAKW